MAPKSLDKQQQLVGKQHSNTFYVSAYALCHNKRLKQKRLKWTEAIKIISNRDKNKKTETRKRRLNALQPDVHINLLSDDDIDNSINKNKNNSANYCVTVAPIMDDQPTIMAKANGLDLERATILGLMPVVRPSMASVTTVNKTPDPPRKRKSRNPKKCSQLQPMFNPNESIILSDDSDLSPDNVPDLRVISPQPRSEKQIVNTCLPQNSIQVDEVTVSLVPRSLSASSCARRSLENNKTNNSEPFPMLPDETTVQTVIANRIYELSLTKLREGLASCGIPEFSDASQKISPQKRKGNVNPPMATPPQAPISLKLSSDLSISLISDDDDDDDQNHRTEPILSPALLQKLPINVSIAPVSVSNVVQIPGLPKRKLG
ncbi:protein a6 isoform X1 [Glossina fuscipes]|uniref:Protein a6 isoform X1 n=1 Tax=Glossina fuscipes TaxID=7396 RepID=A0A9C5Z4G1_9MUSC|nr:protein a6 isoform X1 [Glossina fuscipes]KAI9582107.1 hypothetical protein GQX74_011602 [Glossina fuscipes]